MTFTKRLLRSKGEADYLLSSPHPPFALTRQANDAAKVCYRLTNQDRRDYFGVVIPLIEVAQLT